MIETETIPQSGRNDGHHYGEFTDKLDAVGNKIAGKAKRAVRRRNR